MIQREFIESLILDLGADFRVAVIFALPRCGDHIFIRPLWRILQYDWIILQFGVPRTDEEWNYVTIGAAPLSRTAYFKKTTESLQFELSVDPNPKPLEIKQI